jgi:hypothetical protein
MTPTPGPPDDQRTAELEHLLATYLATAPSFRCPGCDGMLIADTLTAYPAAASTGGVPGEAELCGRHPELTPQVIAFFFFLLTVASNPAGGPEVDRAGRRAEYDPLPPCLI